MYPIEIKLAPKSVWFTPAEAKAYYGRYSRDGVTIHWWGDGTGASNHDNIVNYFLRRTDGSVNYVLSDNKITMMVNPDNVAWTSQSGNATTVSIEHQPTLGAEGYKKSGWLVWQLEERYGKTLRLYPHNYWWQTQCPGTISLDRIRQEANKWKSGAYNQQPTPTPTPPPNSGFVWTKLDKVVEYKCVKQPTNLWNFNTTSWSGFTVVKAFNAGDKINIYGKVVHPLGGTYLLTEYSFTNKITNGFNAVDMEVVSTPPPPSTPEWQSNRKPLPKVTNMYTLANAKLVDVTNMAVQKVYPLDTEIEIKGETKVGGNEFYLSTYSYDNNKPTGFLKADLKASPTPPPPVEPEKPEWVKNLRDIDDTKYWFAADQELIDITTGKPTGTKSFKVNDEFIASALTVANNVEYRITEYSLSKGIYNGVPTVSLTLTPPEVPDVPPVPEDPGGGIPPEPTVPLSAIQALWEAIKKLFEGFFNLWGKK